MKLFGLNIERAQREAQATQPATQGVRGQDFLGNIIQASANGNCMTLPAVYRAITLRANTMAKLVAQYQRRDANGHNFVMDLGPTRGNHINYLLQVRPNPYMGWTVLMKQAEIRRLLFGNAYVYVERGMDEEIKAFWLCNTANYNTLDNSYTITYYVGNLVRSMVKVPARDILHIRNEFTQDGFTGIGTIHYAARTFNTLATQDQLAQESAAKGGLRKMVVQEQPQQNFGVGKNSKEQMTTIANNFEENIAHKDIIYVPNAAQIHDFSQTLSELQLLESRKWGIVEIANFFSVPVQYLGDSNGSNYKSPEFATLDLLSNGISPTICEWEDELNGKLLDEMDFGKHRYHLCEQELFRLDRQSQNLWNKSRMETGVASINELRAEQELPRIDNGDDHYVSTNLAVAGSPKLSGVDTKVTAKEEL